MTRKTANDPTSLVLEEMSQQPAALSDLAEHYLSGNGFDGLPAAVSPLLFTGMGASYHAALAGAEMCCRAGVNARAVETSDLLSWPQGLPAEYGLTVYLSQSGASREVAALLKKVDKTKLAAVTNDTQSTLACSAVYALPLLAGSETLIASKTYLNSLALVWLLSRRFGNLMDGSEAEQLKRTRQRIRVMLEAGDSLRGRWSALLPDPQELILLGEGLQAVSARQASLMLAEWAKVPSAAYSLDAFRHGFVELLDPGVTVLVFQSSSVPGQDEEYLRWKETTGARVLRVLDGFPQELAEAPQPPVKADAGLSLLTDAVCAQLLAVELAQQRGTAGFRYLSKVVK